MNEIKRLQELAGINEMRINNPTNSFKVTELGIQMLNNFVTLKLLGNIFEISELLNNEGPESIKFEMTQTLYIYSDEYGEGIIKIKENNNIDEYFSQYNKIWDDDKEQYILDLKKLEQQGYITKLPF